MIECLWDCFASLAITVAYFFKALTLCTECDLSTAASSGGPSQMEGFQIRIKKFRGKGLPQRRLPYCERQRQTRGEGTQKDRVDGPEISGLRGERRGVDHTDRADPLSSGLDRILGIGRKADIEGPGAQGFSALCW